MADLKRIIIHDPVTDSDCSVTAGGDLPVTLDSERISTDATGGYMVANIDNSGDPKYYGFEDASGNYYIMKETGGAYTYTAGTSGYSTAWTNRASESYDTPSATF
jgi:hypothetical protein